MHDPRSQCDPYVRYIKGDVPETLHQSLSTFLSDRQSEFVNIGGCRDTMYFGEYGYKYSGGKHDAKDMPTAVTDLLNLVKENLSDPAAKMNSCLITRYKSGADHIPPHRDDEPLFDPNSEILTVSIGAQRTMSFTDNFGKNSQTLLLDSHSVLVTSRRAQDFWKHSIDKIDELCERGSVSRFATLSKLNSHYMRLQHEATTLWGWKRKVREMVAW